MSPEALALVAAACYACGQIAVKFGTQGQAMIQGFILSLATGVVVLVILATAILDSWSVPWPAVVFFAAAGLAGPGLGRLLAMRAVRDAGTSVGAPVQASTNPLLSSLAGVVVFGERIDGQRAVALALIIVGIFACARGGSANRGVVVPPGRGALRVLLWPIGAGAAFAMADLLRKIALNAEGEPLLGALIGVAIALAIWTLLAAAVPRWRSRDGLDRRHLWFAVYGVFSAVGLTALLSALRIGELSVVIPIFSSMPVIVILLGAVLLRRYEVLRLGTAFGATVVFIGVAALALA